MRGYRYIVVEGVIGVGKTTLVELLTKDFQATSVLEIVEENPFLVKGFYEDMKNHAFNTELFFLLSRFWQQRKLSESLRSGSGMVISDYLFAKNRIFAELTLAGEELDIFDSVFRPLNDKVERPDLIVYLRADADSLMRRIHLRERSFERNMEREYIQKLVDRYDRFFTTYHSSQVMTIDASEIDFVFNFRSYSKMKEQIGETLKQEIRM